METNGVHRCKICNVEFTALRQLATHIQTMGTTHQDYKIKCTHEGCSNEYSKYKSLMSHIVSHRERYKCTWCGIKEYVRKDDLARHVATKHPANKRKEAVEKRQAEAGDNKNKKVKRAKLKESMERIRRLQNEIVGIQIEIAMELLKFDLMLAE